MRVTNTHAARAGSALLAISIGALVFGYALFFLTPKAAVSNPLLWFFAVIAGVAVALPCAIQSNKPRKRTRS